MTYAVLVTCFALAVTCFALAGELVFRTGLSSFRRLVWMFLGRSLLVDLMTTTMVMRTAVVSVPGSRRRMKGSCTAGATRPMSAAFGPVRPLQVWVWRGRQGQPALLVPNPAGTSP